MATKTVKYEGITWYHLTDFTHEDTAFLQQNFRFHPLDIKDCLGEDQRTKIDTYKNYIFIIIQIPEFDRELHKVQSQQFYLFVGKDYVVTISQSRQKFLNNFFYKMSNNQRMKKDILSEGAGYLLYRILDDTFRQQWKLINKIDDDIKQIEHDIDLGRGKRVVYEIAHLRKALVQIRSVLSPLRLAVNELSRMDASFLKKDMNVYFDDIDDYVDKIWFSLENYRDRLLSLHDINESLISYNTNKFMGVLTMFSVALLPLTVLTGVYGMNVDLPFIEQPGIIWGLFISLIVVDIFLFVAFKRNDWI